MKEAIRLFMTAVLLMIAAGASADNYKGTLERHGVKMEYTIGGGKVTATGSGVSGIYGFNIIITGGEVTATTGSGNGSYGISGYNVIISDGIVMARGNRSGIGSGTNSTDGSLTISGGTVTATGSGYGIIGSNVIINGGEVTANGLG